jgi:2,3-dihydroxy-p-cumate/2,3-dihydroxybenzoate 3,4-dioxygenase
MTDPTATPGRPRGPHGMAYIRLAVPDIAATREFYEYHVGLEAVDVSDEQVTLRADVPHHCVDLRSDPSLTDSDTLAVGFSVESPEVLADLAARIDAAGLERFAIDDYAAAHTTDGFAVKDPNGLTIELIYELQEFAEPPLIELRPLDIVHPFISTDKYEESMEFYLGVLGFLPSDYIADQTAFIRAEDRYHHSFAVRRDSSFYVAHIAFRMKSFDHVMRGRARAIYKDVPIASDIVNHSASTSIAFYMHDTRHGPRVELCDGHRVLTEDEHERTHRARRMSVDPRNIDVWRAAADDWGRF